MNPTCLTASPHETGGVVGQQHIVGKDKLLYRAIKADKLTSVIFTALREPERPPLAKVIATTSARLYPRSMQP